MPQGHDVTEKEKPEINTLVNRRNREENAPKHFGLNTLNEPEKQKMKTGQLAVREEFGRIRRIQFGRTCHSAGYRTQ